MPTQTFKLNGKRVRVEAENDERLLWVLRDRLGVKGPKYGCGINVCKACTCHINGSAFNPCSVPVSRIKATDEITTIEGLGATVGKELHPMQEAWLAMDVAQCGYCQPGQIMSAVSRVNQVRRKTGRRRITDGDIEQIRNICRCGTYPRIREAIRLAANDMPTPKRRKKVRRKKRRKGTENKRRAAERKTKRPARRSSVEAAPEPTPAPTAAPAQPAPAAPPAATPAPTTAPATPAVPALPDLGL